MSAMTKDHDIDDILESLEELLFEADAQRDSESQQNAEQHVNVSVQSRAEMTNKKNTHVQDTSFLLSVDVKNDDVLESADEDAMPLMPSRVLLTENMLEDNPQVLLPLVEKIAVDMIEASQMMEVPRFHLRPEMEVGFPAFMAANKQMDQSLPLNEVIETTPEVSPEESISEPTFDSQQLEKLLEDVGDDVLYELQLILPKMIKSSMKRHLEKMIDDTKIEEVDRHE